MSTHVVSIFFGKKLDQKSSGLRFTKLFSPNFLEEFFGMAAIPFLCNGLYTLLYNLVKRKEHVKIKATRCHQPLKKNSCKLDCFPPFKIRTHPDFRSPLSTKTPAIPSNVNLLVDCKSICQFLTEIS